LSQSSARLKSDLLIWPISEDAQKQLILPLLQRSRDCTSEKQKWQESSGHDDSEKEQLEEIVGLCSISVAVTYKTADPNPQRCCLFHDSLEEPGDELASNK